MSNYGVFEASSTDGHEEEQRQRQATRDLGTAIEAAREGFGDFLGSATDKDDYKDRLALVMNDLMQKVADAGVMPVPGVMRKVKAALRPEFRTSVHEKTALKWYVTPSTDPKLGDDWSTWDPTKGSYPTEPWASVAYTEYGASPSWSWGVHRPSDETDIIFAVGYEADRETAFDKATSALRELRTQYAASRKQADDHLDDFNKSTGARAVPYLEAYPDSTATGDEWTIVDESGTPLVKDQGEGGGDVPYYFRSEDAAEEAAQKHSRKHSRFRTAAPQTISDADKAKVIPAGSTEIPQSAVASALEAGERVYGLSPSGSEILAIRSADTDAQFYWVAGSGSMWDVSASRRAAGWRDEVGQAVDEYLDATSTPRIAPHPEYGEGVWSDEGVKQRVLSLNPNLPTPELVDAIMREMGDFYDSIDRELAFWHFSQVTGNDYDDYYNAWLNIPSGKYFSRRKSALKWKDTDFNSWVKMDGGAWSISIDEVGGTFWLYFYGGPADGQMEQLSASSMEEAKAEAESIVSSKGITASRKQADAPTTAQILTKNGWETVPFYRFVQFEFDSGTVVVEVELNGRVQQIELPRQQFKLISQASRKKAGLSDWFIDGTDFAQMSYDGMPDGNFAFLNVYLHGDGYYMWSVDVENGQANHGKLNATDLESAIAEAEPLISAELGLDPFMYSTRKQAEHNGWTNYETWEVAAILDNDETAQEELAQGISDVTHLRDIGEFYAQGNGIDFGQVNWQEIYDANSEFTASLKQAGSAQVLQKLENALNDQRSVDVICSNSPDGSFSSEREIPVDEGLQKVRGWINAGDLVDTAQDGGNFFDFEHRASGENVNFYITQEY